MDVPEGPCPAGPNPEIYFSLACQTGDRTQKDSQGLRVWLEKDYGYIEMYALYTANTYSDTEHGRFVPTLF